MNSKFLTAFVGTTIVFWCGNLSARANSAQLVAECRGEVSEKDAYLGSMIESARQCREELRGTQRTLEATQAVCREEVIERQRKCEVGLCQ